MAAPFIKNSFAGGEWSPSLYGRTDLEQYRTAAAVMRNFFVDYRGGATTRAGTQHVGVARTPTGQTAPLLVPFIFSTSDAWGLVLTGDGYMRFFTQGAFVTETPVTITAASNANPLTVTVASGTWAVGDWLYLSGVTGLARPNGVSGVNGRTLEVQTVAGSVLTLADPVTGSSINASTWTAYASGGTVARIYSIKHPWAAADLPNLRWTQSADVLTITGLGYPPYDVERQAATNWIITQSPIGNTIGSPQSLTVKAVNGTGAAPQFDYPYAVTAVDAAGQESLVGYLNSASCSNDALDQTKGIINRLDWYPVSGAAYYNVYKSVPIPLYSGMPPVVFADYFFGFVGQTVNTTFFDSNYAIDFSIVPPTGANPFATGTLASIVVNQAGFGYLAPAAAIQDAKGTGAVLTATANSAGAVSVALAAPGSGYTAPSVVVTETNTALGTGMTAAFSGVWQASGSGFVPAPGSITFSGGTGYHIPVITATPTGGSGGRAGQYYCTVAAGVPSALNTAVDAFVPSTTGVTLTLTVADTLPGQTISASGALATAEFSGGDYPAVVCYFQQRRVYAASLKNPDTLWFSRTGQYNNFDVSIPVQPSDAITATLASTEVNQIVSLTPMPSGLIALSSDGAWQIVASGSNGFAAQPLTPTSISAEPQAFTGASSLPPLRINYDVLFEASRGGAVRDLSYNFYVNVYTGVDVSFKSSHLLSGRSIIKWAYAEQPFYVVWAVRDDGALLSLTYLKEQELAGWARHDTQGRFWDVIVLPEGTENVPYFVVQRYVNGEWVYMIERMASRISSANAALGVAASAEAAWCVDDGLSYALNYPAANLSVGAPQYPQQLGLPEVLAGGAGYSSPTVAIEDATGYGAVVTANLTGGVITSLTLWQGGYGYTQPVAVITDATGSGAELSVPVLNLMQFVADANVFGATQPGDVLRVLGGVGDVVTVQSATSVLVNMREPIGGLVYQPDGVPVIAAQAPGSWSLTRPVSVIGGLDHLNGSEVCIVADGSVAPSQTVVDGCITLPEPATQICAGHAFTCQLMPLPFDVGDPTMQGRRKQVPAVTLRVLETRGLSVGVRWDDLVEVKDRSTENFGDPITLSEPLG